ncbi:MAG: GatB/YqeY domain-containing protein [Bacilli bacterium]|nr:GatB/YqeY domain-containing protein [Bacilli bacterium]
MKERIVNDLKEAMKAQDKELLAVIRMVKGAISLEEINTKKELTDNEIISIVAKQIKTRKESIEDFKKGNRQDLIDQANREIEILSKYMPEQLSLDEVNKIIDDLFDELKPTSMADMGKVMASAKEKLNGQADMSYVSKIIREKLN